MRRKKVKLIYFSERASTAKQFELSWPKFLAAVAAFFIVMLFAVSVSLALLTEFYENLEIASLSKVNTQLNSELTALESKLQHIQTQVKKLEQEDDELRLVANLPEIDPDERTVGIGGVMNVSYDMPGSGGGTQVEKVYGYQELLASIERRVELTKRSRERIRSKLEQNNKMMKHTPSIRPLIDGRITDRFGMRLHPIIEKLKRHPGIDIAAERGTEVFATAAGTVDRVVTEYKVNRSYGKYIIIDHGYGIKTLYGHLSKVMVREGQRVDRRNPIGLVGDTGRATGPHLHYEVRKDGKLEDPLKYILD